MVTSAVAQCLWHHSDFFKEIVETVGEGSFTASSLAMKDIYVPRGISLRRFHSIGVIVPVSKDGVGISTWRLAPGVIDHIRAKAAA